MEVNLNLGGFDGVWNTVFAKAKLQKEGIFFLIHLFAGDILLMKKLEIEETKTT